MKFIEIFTIIVALNLLVSITCKPNTSLISSTTPQKSDDGNILFLTLHKLHCGSKSALSYFYYDRNSKNRDMVRYEYSCLHSNAIVGESATEHQTPVGTISGKKSVDWLDRHQVQCPAGQILRGFNLVRDTKDNIRYNYTCVVANTLCCKNHSTHKNDIGGRETFYLDRHPVGDKTGLTMAISGFKLNTNQTTRKIWYTYSMCQLKDMDAAKEVEKVEKDLTDSKASLAMLLIELEAAQAKITELNKRVLNSERSLQKAQSHDGLKAKC